MHVNRNIKFLLGTNGLILFSGALLGPIYALFVEEVGGDVLDAGMAGAAFAFSAGLVSLFVGRFGDRVKRKGPILALGYVIVALGFFLYNWVDSMKLLLVAQVIIGVGEALYSPMFDALYSENLDEGKFSSEWGMWECMNYWTSCFAAIIGAVFVNHYGFKNLFLVMGGLAVWSAVQVCFWAQKKNL